MQNYSPATVAVFSGLSYTMLNDIKARKTLCSEKVFISNFYCNLSFSENIYFLDFGFKEGAVNNPILMIPLMKKTGLHYFPVKRDDIQEYLFSFFAHKTEYTFTSLIENKVSETTMINKRIAEYCEMMTNDIEQIISVVRRFDEKSRLSESLLHVKE